MATGMHGDERSVDCLVLCHHDQDRKVSAKSVTMRAMTLCKNLSGYRELLLKLVYGSKREHFFHFLTSHIHICYNNCISCEDYNKSLRIWI